MKEKLLIVFLLLIGISHAASINNYNILFDVQDDLTIKEYIRVEFDSPLNLSVIEYKVDGIPRDIVVNDDRNNLDFFVRTGDISAIVINPRSGTRAINIEFTTSDLIFTAGERFLFFTDFSSQFAVKNLTAELKLPESYGVVPESIRPSADIRSDGRRISVVWTLNSFTGDTSFTAKFESLIKSIIITPIVFGFLVVIILLVLYYRRRVREHFMKGFSEDEQKVIDHISSKGRAYQNRIGQDMKFSRAKMTRIVSKLEAKGLIEKKKKGRTNRLLWKK